jgi:hypothetical protein
VVPIPDEEVKGAKSAGSAVARAQAEAREICSSTLLTRVDEILSSGSGVSLDDRIGKRKSISDFLVDQRSIDRKTHH